MARGTATMRPGCVAHTTCNMWHTIVQNENMTVTIPLVHEINSGEFTCGTTIVRDGSPFGLSSGGIES